MIHLKTISKTYSDQAITFHALTSVDLKIENGTICGIFGESGAGKSTLLRTINLLERPTSGEVWVNGTDLTSLSAEKLRQARHHIGMIFQHFNLLAKEVEKEVMSSAEAIKYLEGKDPKKVIVVPGRIVNVVM